MSPTAFKGHKHSKNCLKLFDTGQFSVSTIIDIEKLYKEGDFIYIENSTMSAVIQYKRYFQIKNYTAFEYFYFVNWQNTMKKDSWSFVEKSRPANQEEIKLLKYKFKIK